MKKTNKSLLTSQQAAFLQELESEISLISAHWDAVRSRTFADRAQSARVAYREGPSDRNFEALKLALVEEHLFTVDPRGPGSKVASTVAAALEVLHEKKLKPFATPIIQSALGSARRELEETRKSENDKSLKSFGRELHTAQTTEAIEAVSNRCAELAAIASLLDQQPPTAGGLIKLVGALRALSIE